MYSFGVVQQLKATLQTAHMSIIVIAGLTETDHLVAALDADGVHCFTQPIKPCEVMARMTRHLQGARDARNV